MNRGTFKKQFSIGYQGLQCSSRFTAILTIALGFLATPVAKAQLTTFAQFSLTSNGIAYTFTGTGATLTAQNVALSFFRYGNTANLPADLAGSQSAHLNFTSITTLGATVSGSELVNIFNGTGANSAMITITRDTPAAEGSGSRTILLQVVFTPYTLSGFSGGGSATLSASSLTGNVTFTSDFLAFQDSVENDLDLSFSSINPGLNVGAGGFLNNFTAAATGTFLSNIVIPGPPTLQISALPGAVQLHWPTNAVGYLLETNNALTLPAGWGVLTSTYNIVATNYVVTNSTAGATMFYRLHKP